MGKLQKESSGFTILEVIIGILLIVCLAFVVHFITHRHHQTSTNTASTSSQTTPANTSNNSSTNSYATLPPATVPSKAPECSQTLTFSSDGSSEPVSCANGDLNVLDWKALAALEPKVMTLGYGATSAQVQAALCADTSANISNPIEETNYQIASLYYGWSFTTNPSVVLTNGTCENVDD